MAEQNFQEKLLEIGQMTIKEASFQRYLSKNSCSMNLSGIKNTLLKYWQNRQKKYAISAEISAGRRLAAYILCSFLFYETKTDH